MLSTNTISCLVFSKKESAREDPIKPAPPVIRIFMYVEMLLNNRGKNY